MKTIVIFILILSIFTSCAPSFDFYEAEKLIEYLKRDGRIYRITSDDDILMINGQKVSQDKDEIIARNKKGFNYKLKTDYLKSINVSKEDFNSFLLKFKKTKAYSVDYLDHKAYFMMDGFLDGSKGYLYSKEDLKSKKNKDNKIVLFGGSITVKDKIGMNWYSVSVWY